MENCFREASDRVERYRIDGASEAKGARGGGTPPAACPYAGRPPNDVAKISEAWVAKGDPPCDDPRSTGSTTSARRPETTRRAWFAVVRGRAKAAARSRFAAA